MRIGINVPDELLKKLEPIRGTINLSEEFRAMLEEKAQAYEKADKSLTEATLNKRIAELRKTYKLLSIDWQKAGQEDAKRWCDDEKTSFRMLTYYYNKALNSPPQELPVEAGGHLHNLITKSKEDLYALMDQEPDVDWWDRFEKPYKLGWKAYLQAIARRIDSELQSLIAKNEATIGRLKIPAEMAQSLTKPPSIFAKK